MSEQNHLVLNCNEGCCNNSKILLDQEHESCKISKLLIKYNINANHNYGIYFTDVR